VGEIQDEFDDELPEVSKEGENTVISAHMLIEDVNDHFQINIEDEDNDTIGGFIFSQLQKIPKKGAYVEFQNYRFVVMEMDRRSITRIKVTPLRPKKRNLESLERPNK
jgi:CBS domain containing-hemolysin-like protein